MSEGSTVEFELSVAACRWLKRFRYAAESVREALAEALPGEDGEYVLVTMDAVDAQLLFGHLCHEVVHGSRRSEATFELMNEAADALEDALERTGSL